MRPSRAPYPWFTALIACACLLLNPAGCGDETGSGDEDLVDTRDVTDTGSPGLPDLLVDAAPEDAEDAEDAEVGLPCTPADDRCTGARQREVCVDGFLAVERCEGEAVCFEGVCAPVVCEPYAVARCEGERYEGCNPMGTGEGVYDCRPGFTCVDDACIPRLCEPGELRCLEDGDSFELCNDAGTAFENQGNRCSDADIKQVCESNACQAICEAQGKESSYIGCDYWAVDLDNYFSPGNDAAGQIFAVVVSNAHPTLTAQVAVYDAASEAAGQPLVAPFELPPGELRVIELPPDCYVEGAPPCEAAYAVNNTMHKPAAYRVVSDVPITAYQFNPLDNTVRVFSNDASLLIPRPSLGARYLVMSRGHEFDGHPGFLTIVGASEGPVEVTITPTVETDGWTDPSGQRSVPPLMPGQSHTFTLEPYDVLNLATARKNTFDAVTGALIHVGDLTGTEVRATGRVAVFAGVECVDIPQTSPRTQACDHIEQQLYPTNRWGRTYVAPKSWQRGGSRDFWRVLALEDGTLVRTTPPQPGGSAALDAGEWFEFPSAQSFVITADRPILVGQFLAGILDPIDPDDAPPPGPDIGTGNAGIGDPTFILGVPVEQYRDDYIFLVPDAYEEDYITIVATDTTTLTLDGQALDEAALLAADAKVGAIGDSGYRNIRLRLPDGPHRLTASEPVGLFVYGFDGSVSYGYPAGLDLRELRRD